MPVEALRWSLVSRRGGLSGLSLTKSSPKRLHRELVELSTMFNGSTLLSAAPFTGLVALLGFEEISTLARLLSCADENQCNYQREDENSSSDHEGEMHARDERLLITHHRAQDRDPDDPTHLPAHIQHTRGYA